MEHVRAQPADDRSLGNFWPRAQSKLYEEPEKLASLGLARARQESVGARRTRTVYSITPKGRRALAGWLATPGAGPTLEFEQLLQVFFSDSGSKRDVLATVEAAHSWAAERAAFAVAVGQEYEQTAGPFPERAGQRTVTVRFLIDFYSLVGEWARWAHGVVAEWPDDPSQARVDEALLDDTLRRAVHTAESLRHALPQDSRRSRS